MKSQPMEDRMARKAELVTEHPGAEALFRAGYKIRAVYEYYGHHDLTMASLRAIRDRVFDAPRSDPAKVKALSDGPLLNANELVHYTLPAPKRKPAPTAEQLSILDIVDGHMGRTA